MLNFKLINALAGAAVIALLINEIEGTTPLFWYFLIFIIWFLITGFGSWFIRWNYHFKSMHKNYMIHQNWVSITFDDGPNQKFTPKVLSLLKQYNAKATFFCIGCHAEKHPKLLEEIIADQHTIGNHTYSHANGFGFFSSKKIITELNRTNEIVQKITGLEMKLFRPAFGITNPSIKKALKITGLISVGWSKRSFDTTKLSEELIFKRITNSLKKGDIILLHDSSDKSIAVLERLLLFLQKKQLQSVTVDRLLEIKPYA